MVKCGRCGAQLAKRDAEVCWWRQGWLCVECWDVHGECGHKMVDMLRWMGLMRRVQLCGKN